jgi:hypothetical protein
MVYNPLNECEKYLKAAKKGQDWWALPYALSELESINKILEKFNEFKNSDIYKKRVSVSLKEIQKRVKRWDRLIKQKGDKAFADVNEKEWHESNKRYLRLLQKEAKRLKL